MARLDTVRHLETPEGVVLELPVAGPMPRALAWALDLGLRSVVYSMLASVLALLGDTGLGLLLVATFSLEWFYPVVFEIYAQGATPGKKAMGLAVVMADGTPVTGGASLLRNLLRFADMLPFGYLVGFLSTVIDPSFRRLGDLAAGTVVVHRERHTAALALPHATPQPVPVALAPDEQRAVVAFAARSGSWSPERQQELAAVLEPLVGTPPKAAATRLLGMARWLQGER